MNHFGCFWPEHIELVAGDQLEFLDQHLLTPGHEDVPVRMQLSVAAKEPFALMKVDHGLLVSTCPTRGA
jgi:hypothetical protein